MREKALGNPKAFLRSGFGDCPSSPVKRPGFPAGRLFCESPYFVTLMTLVLSGNVFQLFQT